jgi:hypothetical protein
MGSDIPINIHNGIPQGNSASNIPQSGTPEDTHVSATTNDAYDHATTTFLDNKDTVTRDESHIDHIDKQWLATNDTQAVEQTIIDFLSKPIVLASGSFSITDTYSFLNNYSMPLSAFTSPQGELWATKLRGFFGIRMDMRFRIVINGNRFQQGRYCIGFMPLAGANLVTSPLKGPLVNNMHMATLVQRTTIPHVEFDINTETSAELLIPFISTQNFWPLNSVITTNDVSSLGYLNLYPYSPLVSPAGSTVASYTLYVSFENIKLFGASSPQGGLAQREVANKLNGPISGVAGAVSKGFKAFAQIPALSAIATPVSWIADRIANTAAIFGFSKPTQGDSLMKVEINNNPGHSNVDGDSDVKTLSYLQRPGVTTNKGLSGTDLDEMDFSYVTRKYAYFQQFSWTTAGTVGTVLTTIPVNPAKYVVNSSVYSFTPVGFVGSFFSVWRGSLKFRFKLVKTEFHSGRVQVCFYPTDESTYSSYSFYVNRQIIDIRENIEFEVIVPYISRQPWVNSGQSIGNLTVEVTDPLVAPSTVASTITFLVEVSGGDDIEFAQPNDITWVPKYAVPQSGLESKITDKGVSFNIGNSSIVANSVAATAFTIGDKVSSFRTLLKRFTPIYPSSKSLASTTRAVNSIIQIVPDMIPVQSTSTTSYSWSSDSMSTVASCYAMWTGGIRIKDVVDLTAATTLTYINSPLTVCCTLQPNFASSTTTLAQIINNISTGSAQVNAIEHQAMQVTNNNNSVSIEIPQYTSNLARNKFDCLAFQADSPPTYYNYIVGPNSTNATAIIAAPISIGPTLATLAGYDLHNIYRSLADDGNFHTFVSVPPMVAFGSGAVASFY